MSDRDDTMTPEQFAEIRPRCVFRICRPDGSDELTDQLHLADEASLADDGVVVETMADRDGFDALWESLYCRLKDGRMTLRMEPAEADKFVADVARAFLKTHGGHSSMVAAAELVRLMGKTTR